MIDTCRGGLHIVWYGGNIDTADLSCLFTEYSTQIHFIYNIDTHIFIGVPCMYIFVILTTLMMAILFSYDIIVFPLCITEGS